MIIDPLTFVPLELDRHLSAAHAAQAARAAAPSPQRPERRRRGLRLRLAVWATGRGMHA